MNRVFYVHFSCLLSITQKPFLIGIILFLLSFNLSAQSGLDNLRFIPISMKSGLSSATVRSIFQDSRGFIWVGTQDGLNRYDGYTFKTYRPIENDSFSIQGVQIPTINEDQDGNLWIGTWDNGLMMYHRQEDRFYHSPITHKKRICQVFKDTKNDLWVIGQELFYKIEAKTQKLIPQKNSGFYYYCITEGDKNELWLGTASEGILVMDATSGKIIKRYQNDKSDPNSLADNNIREIIYDKANQWVWIATFGKGLEKLDLRTQKFQHFAYDVHNPHTVRINQTVHLIKTGNYIWVGTENGGLSIVNSITNRFTHYFPDKTKEGSFNDVAINGLYQDKQKRVWIGTFMHGLNVVDSYAQKFENISIPLENQTVNTVLKDSQNRLWIGTEDGIAVLKDGQSSKVYQYEANNNRSLSNKPALALFEDSKKQIWVGTWIGGLNRFNEKTNDFTHYTYDENNPKGLPNPHIFSLGQAPTGELLVGTWGGIAKMEDEQGGKFVWYEKPVKTTDTNPYAVNKIFADKKGQIWIGQSEGLSILDIKKGIKTKFKNSSKIFTKGIIYTLYQDTKGTLWVGAVDGLYKMIGEEKFKRYTTLDGLPNNNIFGILEDSKGNLWISTNQGLTCFNPSKQTFRNYDEGDGIQGNYFRPNSCFKSKNGEFFFGGAKGLTRFYPDSLKDNPHQPPIIFTDLKIFNKSLKIGERDSILKKNIQETKEITLTYQDKIIIINFIALNYTLSEKNEYAYRLVGFEKNWNYVGNKHETTYTNLPAGTYTFWVKASNNDGVWNQEGAKLIIHILPPWWEAWWFRVFVVLFFLVSGPSFYFLRISTIKKQNQRLEKIIQEKTEELQTANEELQTTNEELHNQKEETLAKNEEIHHQYQNLRNANLIIIEQNKEINRQNETLEEEVKIRTQELVDYNQQLEQYAFITAHNLRAPVSRILGLGQLLNLSHISQKERELYISKLIFSTEELDQVIKDLNTILEVKKDSSQIFHQVNFESELTKVKMNLIQEINNAQANIEADFDEIQSIYSIQPYIYSILFNLLSNAIKYRHPEKSLKIIFKTKIVEEFICLSVADNGLGIDLNTQKDKIFNLYKRFHTHVEGKGMGLFLIKTQVEMLGGKIKVESELNKGSTFQIFFKKSEDFYV